jgi:hypothetical protein
VGKEADVDDEIIDEMIGKLDGVIRKDKMFG